LATVVGLWIVGVAIPGVVEAAQGRIEARARVLSLESQQAVRAETSAWIDAMAEVPVAAIRLAGSKSTVSVPRAEAPAVSLGGGPVPSFAAVGWKHPVSPRANRATSAAARTSAGGSQTPTTSAVIWDRLVDDERVRARMSLEDDRPMLQLEWIAN